MKTKLTLALVAIITGSAFAAIPAVLPEFKNEKQLAEWRAEMAVKNAATTTASEDHAFYTGKPYIETTGSYAFKYRSYNPELARWTSEDPSGFPDGANGSIYAPVPTSQLDFMGLAKLNADGGAAFWGSYYRYGDGGKSQLEAWERAGDWLLANHLSDVETGKNDWINSCALRLSIGLNGSGNNIAAGPNTYLCLDERYIISAKAMNTYITNDWGASDRTVDTAADISTLQADLATYSQNLNKTIYAVAINNGHVAMVSASYADVHFAAFVGGNFKVWILE
jgi:RHS repeat-associated protein